jgi:hypothetical protein
MKGEFTPFKRDDFFLFVCLRFNHYIIFRTYTNAINGMVMITITNAMLSILTSVSQYPDRLYSVLAALVPSVPAGILVINELPTVPWMKVPMYNAVTMKIMANAAPIIISHIALWSAPISLYFWFDFMAIEKQGFLPRYNKKVG